MKNFLLLVMSILLLLPGRAQNYNWAFPIAGMSNEVCNSIAYDASGNIYVAGYIDGSADFNPDPNQTTILNTAGSKDIYMAKYTPAGNLTWAVRMGSTGVDEAKFIRINQQNGDIYLAGTFQNTVDFDFGSPTANLVSAGGYDIFFARYSSAGTLLYARRIGGVNIELIDAMDVNSSLSNNGEITMMGRFTGTVDFDPNSAVVNLVANGSEMFIAKYSNTFSYQSAYKPLTGSVYGKCVSYDQAGTGLYITGGFNGTVDFNFGTPTNNLVSQSLNNDIFLAKYDLNLNYQWAVSMGGNNGAKEGRAVKTDSNNDVVLTGVFDGTVDLDPGAGTNTFSAQGTDVFLAKYSSSNGAHQWSGAMGGTGTDYPSGLAVDANNNIYIGGAFQSTADFDPSSATATLTTTGADDAYFARYDASGNYNFAHGIGGGSGNQAVTSLVLTSPDNLYLCGSNIGTGCDFDPGPGTAIISALGAIDAFVAKYKACPDPIIATSLASNNTPCSSESVTLSVVSGFLGGAVNWQWYSGSCAGTPVGTGTQIVVNPTTSAGYFVRAEGGCLVSPGICSNGNTLSVIASPTVTVLSNQTLICSGQSVMLAFNGANSYSVNGSAITGSTALVNPTITTTFTITGNDGCMGTAVYTQSVETCEGLSVVAHNADIQVYPNPSSSSFYVSGAAGRQLLLLNGQGQEVLLIITETNAIEVKNLAPGLYFLQGEKFNKKIIVTH